MKKIGIITITEENNFGNRLQNYAVQETLKKYGCEVETIINNSGKNDHELKAKQKLINSLKRMAKKIIYISKAKRNRKRVERFREFNNKYVKFSKYTICNDGKQNDLSMNNQFDYFICGSDQIWNPNYKNNAEANFLQFFSIEKRIAFAPSFGSNHLPEDRKANFKKWILEIPHLSVREEAGKNIIEELTGRTDAEVLVDPTMLLTDGEWDNISKKPEQLKNNKFILNYFLGELPEDRKKEIYRIAEENECEVINVLDTKSPFYEIGPSEFLYLEKNAFLICTDSFHSCVFAIIYNRPFIVFDRAQRKLVSMNSRMDTLISKFRLNNRKFNGKITKENLEHDYTEAYQILELERKKSNDFLKNALNIQGEN